MHEGDEKNSSDEQHQAEQGSAEQGQTLVEHLGELRDCLVRAAGFILFGTVVCWIFKDHLFNVIRRPILETKLLDALVFTHPVDSFMAHVKVAVLGGVILTCPGWLYQVWRFVAPGLYSHERKYGLIFISAGSVLFAIGVSFAYFLVLPAAFKFLLGFSGGADKPMITIKDYFSFFTTMMFVFGLAFELPLVIVLLGAIGIVDAKFLREKRRIMIVAMAVVSAIVTPPDAASMLMLLVPLVVLYEISILLVASIKKKKT